MSEIAVMLAEGFEEIEGLTVVDICRRCGIGVTTVSITDDRNVLGSHGIPVIADTVFSEVDFGKIDMIVFFSDPLTAQPHDPDIKALMRIAQVYDIPMAISRAGADVMITSSFMNKEYDHDVINFKKNIENRAETL